MAKPTQLSSGKDAVSRREFLGVAASFTVGPLLPSSKAIPDIPRLVMPCGASRSRVVMARSPRVVDGPLVHRALLSEMMQSLLGAVRPVTPTPKAMWNSLLRPDDVIGLKFNRSGQDIIGTTAALADALIESLGEAGWPPNRIVCLEAPEDTLANHRTIPARDGYDPTLVEFGSGVDQLIAALNQITVLISVPYLKTHNIAGMTAALKNLSHGLVKHPARYHGNGCSPYIADIVASQPIRTRLRFCVVDALRVVFEGGPDASVETISDEGAILASIDPVAVDTVGLMLLNDVRHRHGLPPIVRSPAGVGYLRAAHRLGLGAASPHGIDLVPVEP